MSNIIKEIRLIMTDITDNNNKLWVGKLFDNDTVITEWGRVGNTLQSKTFTGVGDKFLQQKMKEKTSKGYKEIQSIGASEKSKVTSTNSSSTMELLDIALADINPQEDSTKELLKDLIQANRHQITEMSGGKVEVNASGLVTTKTGDIIALKAIVDAKDILVNMDTFIKSSNFTDAKFIDYLEDYLMLVPQSVGSRKGWHTSFFNTSNTVEKQFDFLDQLEKSINLYEDTKKNAIANTDTTKTRSKVFDFTLTELKDDAEFNRVVQFFNSNAKSMHSSYGMKVDKIWVIDNQKFKNPFEEKFSKFSNKMELWHGTAAGNVMSIMHTGLKCAPPSTAAIAGKMFGNGVYFSDQSTKSLNYANGYWTGNSNKSKCYMFLNDVAMGNYQVPRGPTSKHPDTGYDSYFAKSQMSGVANNEMIVFNNNQFYTKYLVGFKS